MQLGNNYCPCAGIQRQRSTGRFLEESGKTRHSETLGVGGGTHAHVHTWPMCVCVSIYLYMSVVSLYLDTYLHPVYKLNPEERFKIVYAINSRKINCTLKHILLWEFFFPPFFADMARLGHQHLQKLWANLQRD